MSENWGQVNVFDRMKQTLDKSIAAVSVKSTEFVEVTKIRNQISALEKEMDSLKIQVGSVYYKQWKYADKKEEELAELCERIQEKEDAISDHLLNIDNLQKENEKKMKSTAGITCSCGRMNLSDATFCASCGEKLQPATEYVVKRCSCGVELNESAKFCSKCGKNLSEQEESSTIML